MKTVHTNFGRAAKDLVWLLDREYPKKPALDLVANRFGLDGDERMVLYRGVFDTSSSGSRERKRIDPFGIPPSLLLIDGYNVLITLESYLSGKRVFRSTDGFVRDVAGLHGRHSFGPISKRGVAQIVELIGRFPAGKAVFFFDSPVSRSGELAAYVRDVIGERDVEGEVRVSRSPDGEIPCEVDRFPDAVVATSDTVIIDRVPRCVDIPDCIISGVAGSGTRRSDILDLGAILKNLH